MAEHFKEAITCGGCREDLERPLLFKCGYVCCIHCLRAEQNEAGGAFQCPGCAQVSLPHEVVPYCQLDGLVGAIRNLQPQLGSLLLMNPCVSKFYVDVTLDASMADPSLFISEDLKTVRCRSLRQKNRSSSEGLKHHFSVLGFPAFSSGRHYWAVDVGSSVGWEVGVCQESAWLRARTMRSTRAGFWTVGRRAGQYQACSLSPKELFVNSGLHLIGVFLEIEFRSISFFNLSNKYHIFTFTEMPVGEVVRPFFALANETRDPNNVLRICPKPGPGTLGLAEAAAGLGS
ncbi:ret finger protein-like 4A [Sorex fumeus]|uniref:ret finger protein-like 4A n=1 Tax=Sorex fumeus TaxID=62283 RepID=UPI0024ADCACC|nr:ret finger protein-like 4A [Sorex fumeus]